VSIASCCTTTCWKRFCVGVDVAVLEVEGSIVVVPPSRRAGARRAAGDACCVIVDGACGGDGDGAATPVCKGVVHDLAAFDPLQALAVIPPMS
jgi:hypothetical protein